jgi:glycine/D-amino acid oxidase-like deaminating enzyme
MNGDYGEMPYGIPHEDPSIGVKITTFYGWDTVETPATWTTPPARHGPNASADFAHQYIPDAAGPLLATRRCLYTLTPDKGLHCGSASRYPQVVIGAGFSGHGFKFTTLMGKMLADLAIEGQTPHNTTLFKVGRFQPVAV